jgi:hypothetical protein
MVCFPLMKRALANNKDMLWWWMSPAEQAAVVFILEQLRPQTAIEIGTQFGGSLQAISKYSTRVYSIDIDPEVPKLLNGVFSNVTYLTGASDDLLPRLFDQLQDGCSGLSFVLIDGDHSRVGVQKDINHVLRFRPTVPLYILMHDSFNPECRAGIRSAVWDSNPHVQAVELDFVPGFVNPAPAYRNELWSGLALAILTPDKRTGPLTITGRAQLSFEVASRYARRARLAKLLSQPANYPQYVRIAARRLKLRAIGLIK